MKNKNLKKINGKTLVDITINLAKKSKIFNSNDIILSSEVTVLLRNIIKKQNIELIKKIAKDYNRNSNNMIYKYSKGEYF